MDKYELSEEMYDIINDMTAGEKISIDDFLDNVTVTVTKDEDFSKEEDSFNMVQADFSVNGRNIASTYDIHVDDLEDVLTSIRNGNTKDLVDTEIPLSELIEDLQNEEIDRD